jgi:hypothetical protein
MSYSGMAVPLSAGAVESLNHGNPSFFSLLRLFSFFTTVSKEVVASYDGKCLCTVRMYGVILRQYTVKAGEETVSELP